ncbi:MAG: hypothetical protein ACOX87_10785 [Chloroflexota bacterium]|jgi:hypothetical protein
MTHSLHRRGDIESLKKDFLILACTAKGFNEETFAPLGSEFVRICAKHKPVNGGDMKTGNLLYVDPEEIAQKVSKTTIIEFTFDNRENVVACLKELKERDLGISIVLTALIEEANSIVEEVGLPKVHTREFSLGTLGKTKLLPEWEVLEFTTMCGHAMVASEYVKKAIVDARKGYISPREAAVQMGKCCSCGNFNVNRAVDLLEKNAPLWTAEYPVY